MKFIKKKNLHEGEELLYTPQLHWFFTIRHIVKSLVFFLILLVLWCAADSVVDALGCSAGGTGAVLIMRFIIKHVFWITTLAVLLLFMWRILQYLNTEYGITNRRLIIKKGVIRVAVAEIPTDRIESIYCVQGIMGRLFHYGTIFISGVGGTMPVFYMVSRPYALRRKIVEIIERNKAITVVHGDLPKVKPVKPEPVAEEEPIYRYGTFVRVLSDNK